MTDIESKRVNAAIQYGKFISETDHGAFVWTDAHAGQYIANDDGLHLVDIDIFFKQV